MRIRPSAARNLLRLIAMSMVVAAACVTLLSGSFNRASAAPTTSAAPATASGGELTVAKAAVLGVVEGLTEYLPVSSTGHLLITERILDVGQNDADREAINSYTVIIQIGAILAVLAVSWRRVVEVLQGLIGRSEPGRKLLFALVVAFIPAAIIGKGGEKIITHKLLKPWPVVAAWIVGGVVLLVLWPKLSGRGATGGSGEAGRASKRSGEAQPQSYGRVGAALESLTLRQAAIIGGAQVLALWPGTSRSLVTIMAALAVGLNLVAAVEFSFLLGLLTLSAATAYEGLAHGSDLVDRFGTGTPLVGIVVAGIAAFISVRWMLSWLQHSGLEVFGYYRIAVGVVVAALLVTSVI